MNITEAKKRFKRVVIWGHRQPLSWHTHSWVHGAVYKAFTHLGFDTYWHDDDERDAVGLNNPGSGDTLYWTEGQVDNHIPVRRDCSYILHNCESLKYDGLESRTLRLQVFVSDIKSRLVPPHARDSVTMIKPFHYTADIDGQRWLYQPWATDLLPHEINLELARHPRGKTCDWIGTIGSSSTEFGNSNEIDGFKRACSENGYKFVHHQGQVSNEDNAMIIRESFLAPTIVGNWQWRKSYLPCRAFKNGSYGALIGTNSKQVAEYFEGWAIHEDNTYSLFERMAKRSNDIDFIQGGMRFVQANSTYINRIETILEQIP